MLGNKRGRGIRDCQAPMLVDVAPPRDHLGFNQVGLPIDGIAGCLGVTGAVRRNADKQTEERDRNCVSFMGCPRLNRILQMNPEPAWIFALLPFSDKPAWRADDGSVALLVF
jgi:hypothetical protein